MFSCRSEVNINERIDAAIKIAILVIYNDDIHLEKFFSTLPPIFAKSEEIQQVFLNLLTNGVQAMEGKGKLTISTKSQNGNVVAKISDTGLGIPQNIYPKFMIPSLSLKNKAKARARV